MKQAELFDVKGHIALVTGAASGLGLAYAEVMAENGAKTVLTDIDRAGLERETSRLRAAGCDVDQVVVDIADTEALRAAIDGTVARYGRLDAVFANAGISSGPGFGFTPEGGIVNVSREKWDEVVAINLTGNFTTMQAAARHMKERRYGRIVVVASIAGLISEPHVGYPYAATKAAMINLVRHAAVEMAPEGVVVNGIAPGPFRTNLAGGKIADPEIAASFAEPIPMKRIADVDEIKGLALLLASPASSFLTGVTIPIDGGHTAL